MELPSFQSVLTMLPGVVAGFTFHEFGHAWTATWFGDDTPRLNGRVTLNPLAHLDPVGTVLLLLGGPGWAKPVEVDPNRVRPRIFGDIVISLAGVIMNFLLALLFLIGYYLVTELWITTNPLKLGVADVLRWAYQVNLMLIGFNLIPLPPLDGFRVIRHLLPDNIVETLYRMGPIFLIILFTGGLTRYFLPQVYEGLDNTIFAIARPVLRALLL